MRGMLGRVQQVNQGLFAGKGCQTAKAIQEVPAWQQLRLNYILQNSGKTINSEELQSWVIIQAAPFQMSVFDSLF